ncbi:sperm associated antigen 9a isoform X5 [Oryzias melastigma]|uniref:C-Jun-amino-terminal kinase-interacting protein 4 n=1 Tax=Oryzias melastigma TaxID=30732 RepID=A0A3B3C7V9_ORYME|nr:sperm associated antigen 9a isoform X5 [Oryzias melastigma]
MELEDGVVYQDDPGTSAMMSERVSGLASSIYREFERLIGKYDEDVVKELMPLVVAVLENLDSVFAENQEHEVELELLKEDNEQLITQYEREKALRKHAEEKFMEFEDTHEQEKKDLQNHVDRMESHSRQLELKIKNYSDQISRLEERELELKKDFNTLHQRHSEMIHNYMEHVERIKMQQISETSESSAVGRVRRERPLSLGIFPSSGRTSLIIPDPQNRTETSATEGWRIADSSAPRSNTSLKDELLDFSDAKSAASASSPSDVKREDGSKKSTEVQAVTGTRSTAVGLPENEDSSDVQDIIESTPELDLDLIGYKPCSTPTKGIENMAFDRNTNSLFEELSSAGTDLIGDVDEGADLLDLSLIGMGREVENLIQENSQLLETKNALNVVNKDLILKVDELTCEKELLQGELEAVQQAKSKLEERNKDMEEELKKVRLEMEDVKQKSKDEEDGDVPTAQRKRFTRVEMARVLMERNQYKERLMELQEAVRWTEMIRASRENPTLTEKKKSSIWQFFSRLFSSSSSAPTMKKVDFQSNMKYNSPGSLVKRSSTFSQFPTEKSKIFDFVNEGSEQCSSPSRKEQKKAQYQQVKAHMQKEDGRVTVHGWSLPGKHKVANGGQVENKMNLPVPVYLRPLDQKDASMKLWCAAGVNMSGGRTSSSDSRQIKGSQSSLDQLEQDSKDQEKGERDPTIQDEVSSRVWVCMSTHSSTKVLVLDATQPSDLLDSFYACNTHVVCIASVPGVLETDYPAGEAVPQDPEFFQSDSVSLAGSLASVGSTGSDGTGAVEGATAVPQTASLGVTEQPTEYSATSDSIEISRESSPAKDCVPAAEEATEATEANAGVGEDGEEDQGTDPNQAGIYTEHVFTDPLGVGPTEGFADDTQRGSGEGGLTSQSEDLDSSEAETLRMSSALPTMWLGAQNGCLYVHSSVARWRKCLHAIKLKDSILSIVHVKGRVLVALADGTLAIFHRGIDDQWDLTNYHLLDLGRPHHSIRCMTVVHDKVWCGYRNKIYVIQPKAMRIEKSFDAHPRKESQVRQLAWVGDGIWVSIRLDSTLRLFHAHTYQHLQDVDIEPYVSKMLGTGKLGFSFVRITALVVSCNRLWVGTGNGVIISIPLSEANKSTGIVSNRPGGAVRVYGEESTDCAPPGGFVPYCSMAHAQLCFHGHREAVKFFVTVPGQAMPPPGCADSGSDDPASESSDITSSEPKTYLVMSGGEGYIDFRIGDEGGELDGLSESTGSQQLAPTKAEQSHLIVWQVTASHD